MDDRQLTMVNHRRSSVVHRPVITLLTSGTRGDVLPYIALGKVLQEAGYNVRIAAPRGFANLIQSHHVPFSPFDGNPTDLMIEQGDFTPFTLGTNPIRSIQATRNFLQKARPLYRHMLHTAAQACRGSDLLIHGLPTIWGAHIAEGLGIPAVRANLQPLTPTREFPSTLLPFRFSLSGIGNLISHWAVTQATWLSWRSEINHARHADFGLGHAHLLDPTLKADSHQPLTLNAFSEIVVPRPRDWNSKQIVTGYWKLASPDWTPPKALQHFLNTSPTPIAIGFGSPGTQGYLSMLEEALHIANAQAVLTIPSKWHSEVKSKNIFPIEYVPHDWLYQHVRVAIHHGGAGTTSASLHAGIPTITMPLAIDQFFWGERVYKIGAGLSIPQRKLNTQNLSQAIIEALNSKEMNEKAKMISKLLKQEDGVQKTIKEIQKIF
ncbi:MAG: glycosyltransferase family 1 protein [Chloroflexi bacterium]|nr:glycosyltransferase family 1 protein [Chloroflexota bacterium]